MRLSRANISIGEPQKKHLQMKNSAKNNRFPIFIQSCRQPYRHNIETSTTGSPNQNNYVRKGDIVFFKTLPMPSNLSPITMQWAILPARHLSYTFPHKRHNNKLQIKNTPKGINAHRSPRNRHTHHLHTPSDLNRHKAYCPPATPCSSKLCRLGV